MRRDGRRVLLLWCGLFCVASVLLPSRLHAKPKNVLLLVSDNHGAADMGCYGHPDIRTPNLDRLAARGTRFQNAFATVASCGPSRGVIYTGLSPRATADDRARRDADRQADGREVHLARPGGAVNLANDPSHAELRRTMSEKLLKRLRETNDYWLERYQLPVPGEKVSVALPPPAGYAPPRKKDREK